MNVIMEVYGKSLVDSDLNRVPKSVISSHSGHKLSIMSNFLLIKSVFDVYLAKKYQIKGI